MKTAVIMDVIVAAVLIGFLISGGRRGLFRSLAGLVILIVALVGAGMAASAFTPPAAKYVSPFLEKRVAEKVDAVLAGDRGDASVSGAQEPSIPEAGSAAASSAAVPEEEPSPQVGLEAQRILKLLHLDDDPAGNLAQTVQKRVRDTGVSVVSAVAQSLAETVIHTLIFLLAFVLLLVLLNVLMHAMNLVLKLPGLHLLNTLGGAALGLLEGGLALFLAVWLLRRFGVSFETQTVAGTHLLCFFTTNTPLSALSFL